MTKNELLHGKWEILINKNALINNDLFNIKSNDFFKIVAPSDAFYADPFIVKENNKYYIFFENYDYKKGIISYITLDSHLNILHQPINLDLSIKSHLSYPYIFKDNNTYYATFESCHSGEIPLFKCESFPDKWVYIKNMINKKVHCADNTIIYHNNLYYLFTHQYENQVNWLCIYYSNNILDNFKEHSLVKVGTNNKNNSTTRSAGKIFKLNNELYRPAQFSDRGINGEGVIIYKIELLSPTQYNEIPINIISPSLFNYRALHTFSYYEQDNILVVDGRQPRETDYPFNEIDINKNLKNIVENNFYIDHSLLEKVFSYNTSGGGINYYNIEIDGKKYEGERNWDSRWNLIKDIYEYKNKRILDIGCNTGITLTYMKKFRNASYCLGVDMPDELLIKTNKTNTIVAAKLLDDAFQVKNDYLQIDLNKSLYETTIGYNFDLVIVMSILKWIEDKNRFLDYIGNFKTIIYEGHEPDDEVINMFKIRNYNYTIIGETQIGKSYSNDSFRKMFLFNKNN